MSKVVREFQVNDLMYGGETLHIPASAKILGGQTRYGNVYLFVEDETLEPSVPRYFKGYRQGHTISLQSPVFRCAILEADKDHCLVYEGLPP